MAPGGFAAECFDTAAASPGRAGQGVSGCSGVGGDKHLASGS